MSLSDDLAHRAAVRRAGKRALRKAKAEQERLPESQRSESGLLRRTRQLQRRFLKKADL